MRTHPRATAQRAFMNFGRVAFTGAMGDAHQVQHFEGGGISGESMKNVERPQNYGFRSVPMAADGEGGPEGHMSSHGGNPSHRIIGAVEDRRHTPLKMPAGASFQYNANGEGTYIDPKKGTFMMAGGHGQDASKARSSLRHVEKQKQPREFTGIGGGAGCLVGTTEVLTPEGFTNIQWLFAGRDVISYDTATNQMMQSKIVTVYAVESEKQIAELRYSGGYIRCTNDHKIWSETKKEYVAAEALVQGDLIRVNEILTAPVESVTLSTPAKKPTVFDLEVDSNHNFFVREAGTTEAILVHNQQQQQGGQQGGQQYKHQGDKPSSELFTEKDRLFGTAEKSLFHSNKDGLYTLIDDKHVAIFADEGTVAWMDKDSGKPFVTKPWEVKKYPHKKPSPSSEG